MKQVGPNPAEEPSDESWSRPAKVGAAGSLRISILKGD